MHMRMIVYKIHITRIVQRTELNRTFEKQGASNWTIDRTLGWASQTIHNKIKRGPIKHIRQQKQNNKVYTYNFSKYISEVGQKIMIISAIIGDVNLFGHTSLSLSVVLTKNY